MRNIILLLVVCSVFLNNCTKKTYTTQSSQNTESTQALSPARRIEILFLGHTSEHHNSAKYAPILATALFQKGINFTYTADPGDLNTNNLSKYDGLLLYANHDSIAPAQAKALLNFVESGKGFIPVHSASWSFRNSEEIVKLMGGQFKTHGTGTFKAKITNNQHPVIQGLSEFETWDETYVHSKINPDITVLMERVEGSTREPWTWVRNQGKGRVFYTAFGHDERTWNNPGFHQLLQNGILWAVGDALKVQLARLNMPTPVYTEAEIPNYEKRDPAPKLQQPFIAAESQKFIQVPVDFELELFASEPDIVNPITMAWDERGRLWIAETIDYPNEVRDEEGVGEDRIKICEDTNGDGKADKFTVFADKLNIPTSMVFANGGIIIAQAPHFIFLKDTDGDDKADVKEVIMTGWGKSDTHAGPSNLKYGFDNMIWGVLGYSGFDGKVGDEKMRFSQGVYHFTPDGKKLEYLGRTSNNTWGLGFSESNDVFISTANNTHSAYLSTPNQYLKRVLVGNNGQAVHKIDGHYDMPVVFSNLRQVDVHGGYTAAAGHNLYTARNFPKSYWNRIAFVCEPTGRVLHNAILEPKGAGFTEANGMNLLASSDEWVGPVHAEVGPDGAVWVADWYDFIIQHNPTPRGFENGKGNAYINPLRDKKHGRIYKIKYKQAKPYQPIQLKSNDTEELLAALQNDNMFWRMTAQRLLVETKNQAALPGLYKIINNQNVDEIGLNSPAVHALWTLHGLGVLKGNNSEAIQIATKALTHPAAGVRKAAVQVLPRNVHSSEAFLKANLIRDPDLHTRLAAVLAIADMPASPQLGKLIYEASLEAENATDSHLSQALYAAALTHKNEYLAAFPKSRLQASTGTDEMSLEGRIAKGLNEEVYPLTKNSQILTQYAPDVTAKEITIQALVSKGQKDLQGVILAQGDKTDGYGLFMQDNKLHMVVKQGGKTYTATSTKPLPDSYEVTARLRKNGAMSIEVDGQSVANGKAPGLFEQALSQGLRVGMDYNNEDRMGTYEGSFGFSGDMKNTFLELNKPGQTPTLLANKVNKSSGIAKKTGVTTILLKVKEHAMQYDKKTFTVKAGETIDIVFENPDFMQHNVVITRPGMLEKVGAAADVLARDPKGAEKNYVPEMPEVLYATKLVDPNGRVTLRFTAPAKAGDYPYVCTFPGHWRIMNGIMKVVEEKI